MNHFNALLNVLEILEVEKETAKNILEHYIVEFLQISVSNGGEVSEEDFQAMKEVAVALGLNEKEFEDAFESKMEDCVCFERTSDGGYRRRNEICAFLYGAHKSVSCETHEAFADCASA